VRIVQLRLPNPWILGALIVALIAFCQGPLSWLLFAGGGDVPNSSGIAISVWLGWTWIATFVAAICALRWRALWLLVAAPFALYWPGMWVFVAHACDLFGRFS
jgi:hypothetical protein